MLNPEIQPLLRALAFLAVTALLGTSTGSLARGRADNPQTADVVGTIEGDVISVHGPMSVESSHGQIKTYLRSGGDVLVKSGQARLELIEGGVVSICGPAHFSVLKSPGALTIALESGAVHAHIEGQLTLTVYTVQVQVHALSIGGGPQDALVALESSGAMCVRANKGAVRLEQQLTGQTILVPQSGEVYMVNGQMETLRAVNGRCTCDLELTASPAVATEVSALASTEELQKKPVAPRPDPSPQAQSSEPIYQVIMPPLRYDANVKVQQEYDPKLVVLLRRVRVRPTLIYQGRVEGDAVVAQATPPAPNSKSWPAKKPSEDSPWDRVRTFLHRLWSPST